jgi:hypothetical protein
MAPPEKMSARRPDRDTPSAVPGPCFRSKARVPDAADGPSGNEHVLMFILHSGMNFL